jgi:hypothetical protein
MNRSFGGIYHLPARWFLAWLIFDSEDGGDIPPKGRFIYLLHGSIFQKMETFKENLHQTM